MFTWLIFVSIKRIVVKTMIYILIDLNLIKKITVVFFNQNIQFIKLKTFKIIINLI